MSDNIVTIDRNSYDLLCEKIRHLTTMCKSVQKRAMNAGELTASLMNEIELKRKEMITMVEGLEGMLSRIRIDRSDKEKQANKRKLAIKIAFEFLGRPYVWGGDDPIQGFDCSGLVVEILKSVGILSRVGDWTADGLYHQFEDKIVDIASEGCLVFWFDENKKAKHVEICINNELSIGASGGGSKTKNLADAIRQNAYIKVRPYGAKIGRLAFVDPFLD